MKRVLHTEFRAPRARRRWAAFTLIEIMVVITLMTVIILGLMAMFSQVQKAFRAGMTQVDVLESGRMAMGMITRELQEITPGYRSAVNFEALVAAEPLPLPLPAMYLDHPEWRTNVLEQLFFLTRENQRWTAIGYRVSTPEDGVGSLYRLQVQAPLSQDPLQLYTAFRNTPTDRFSRILDGVVQFRARTYDMDGYWIVENLGPAAQTNIFATAPSPVTDPPVLAPGEIGYYLFTSNAVPASVELEIGILEQRALERYKSLPVVPGAPPNPRSEFLQEQGGRVHVFRQRVAIRNVDSSAYPPKP